MTTPDPRDVAVGYLIAKGGLDLEEAEQTVQRFDLTDMDFDEVSFVRQGANQKAHVVLWKSDEPSADALASVKTGESVEAAYTTAGSRVLAEELAEQLLAYNPSLTRAQALARTYEANPPLYQAELSASQLATNRQTLRNDEAKRFA
jgi:hypothetical protein